MDVYFESIIFTNSTCHKCEVERLMMGGARHTLVVDLTVTVDVRFTDHLIDFRIRQLLACRDMSAPHIP